jgi:hypothetical protein
MGWLRSKPRDGGTDRSRPGDRESDRGLTLTCCLRHGRPWSLCRVLRHFLMSFKYRPGARVAKAMACGLSVTSMKHGVLLYGDRQTSRSSRCEVMMQSCFCFAALSPESQRNKHCGHSKVAIGCGKFQQSEEEWFTQSYDSKRGYAREARSSFAAVTRAHACLLIRVKVRPVEDVGGRLIEGQPCEGTSSDDCRPP